MNRTRSILHSITELRIRMSTRARIPTHYETLKVKQDCTQDDIKAAYYELSKTYHPDINPSAGAKDEFQRVSNAYEVLGNFSKRKQYDRDLSARGYNATTIQRPTYEMEEDPLSAFYKSRMSNADHERAQEARAHFNFETWTQAHYGQTFRRTLKDKRNKILREQMQRNARKLNEQDKHGALLILITTAFVLLGLLLQSRELSAKYDNNLIAKQYNKDGRS